MSLMQKSALDVRLAANHCPFVGVLPAMNRIVNLFSGAQLTRQTLDAASSAVVLADLSGAIVYANENLARWFGYQPAEINGCSIAGLLPEMCDDFAQGAQLGSHGDTFEQANERTPPQPYCRVRCKDGSEVFSDVTVTAFPTQSESLWMASLANPSVPVPRASTHQAAEADRLEAIMQTASGLAHESRNALQRAVASLDLLELDIANSPRHLELTQKIRHSLSDLINNYDEVRRFAEPIYLDAKATHLIPVCHQAFDLALSRLNTNHVGGRLEIEPSSPCEDLAWCDPLKTRVLFRHLFENSLAAGQGDVTLRVQLHEGLCYQQAMLRIRVLDDGEGFSEAALNRSFEPFFTSRQKGTGLGLSICHRIVEAHRGSISVFNPPNGGAGVEILLPKGKEVHRT